MKKHWSLKVLALACGVAIVICSKLIFDNFVMAKEIAEIKKYIAFSEPGVIDFSGVPEEWKTICLSSKNLYREEYIPGRLMDPYPYENSPRSNEHPFASKWLNSEPDYSRDRIILMLYNSKLELFMIPVERSELSAPIGSLPKHIGTYYSREGVPQKYRQCSRFPFKKARCVFLWKPKNDECLFLFLQDGE